MPDFQGTDSITLQPNDTKVPFKFSLPACSTETANDGAIPYGTTISSIAVTAHTEDGADVTTELINGTPSVSNNVATIAMDYPTVPGAGTYHLTIVTTLDTGAKIEFDFNRIWAKDL